MMHIILIRILSPLFFLLILSISIQAQKADSTQTSGSAVEKPVENLQQLINDYKNTNDNRQKVKLLIEQAKLFRQYGKSSEAIKIALKAKNMAAKGRDYRGMASSSGLLSTLYRESNIISSGDDMLKAAQKYATKIKDKNEAYYLLGNLKQEEAYYKIDEERYSEVIQLLKEGQEYYDSIDDKYKKAYYSAVNDELIAETYLLQENKDAALLHFYRSLDRISKSFDPSSPLKGFIYKGIGTLYLSLGDLEKAIHFLQQAELIAETSNFANLKAEVYRSMIAYYDSLDDVKSELRYNNLYIEITRADKEMRTKVVENLLSRLNSEKISEESRVRKRNIIATGIGVVLLVGGGLFYSKRSRRPSKKIPGRGAISDNHNNKTRRDPNGENISDTKISEETVQLVLDKLAAFETSKSFINHDISLNTLSADFGINQRYLSYIINRQKGKDFASYLNDLRIQYIADRLKNHPEMLTYKISYLAQLCGFSSHSHFSIVFKKVKGISPSQYIGKLKSEKQA